MARILLIDDDEPLRGALRASLLYVGHTVMEASEGREGLARFDREQVDLIIADILMPGQEGIEVLMELRKRKNPVKIIAVSGGGQRGGMEYLRIAKLLGANAVLAKPFNAGTLLKTIDSVLASGVCHAGA